MHRAPRVVGARNADIERNIWFYRIFVRQDGPAIARLTGADVCAAVAGLEQAQTYMATKPGNGLVCEVPPGTADRLKMLRIRWYDHPGTWRANGAVGDLNLPEDEALYEPTHVRFFDGNIVAIDVNRSGPWPTALRDYLRDRLSNVFGDFQMIQIADRTAMERLQRINSVTSLKLQLSGATLARIPQGQHAYVDPLKETLGVGEEGPGGVLEVVWKRFGQNDQLNAQALKALVQYFIEHANDLDEKAQVVMKGKDGSGHNQSFSLTRDFVMDTVKIARAENSKKIDSDDAFEKLRRSYNTAAQQQRFPAQDFLVEDE